MDRVEIRGVDDPRDIVHDVLQRLSDDQLVALPTETSYAIVGSVMSDGAMAIARRCADSTSTAPFSLVLSSTEQALDYVPDMVRHGRRFAQRCWPGPVALQFVTEGVGLASAFPEAVRSNLLATGVLEIRVPAAQLVQDVLLLSPAPIFMMGEYADGTVVLPDAEAVIAKLSDEVPLVLDGGPCQYQQGASVIRIDGETWSAVERGVVGEATLRRLASEVIVFVCTGNTCRSPIAEALFRNMLAERVDCGDDELVDKGYLVTSAGLAAMAGAPASSESIEVLRRRGIDLHSHVSQRVSSRLLEQADRVLTMTRSHRDVILAEHPELADRVEVLSRDGADILDPIGGGMDEYERCEKQIERQLRAILDDLVTSCE